MHMMLQMLLNAAAQNARAFAVDDAHFAHPRQNRLIQILVNRHNRLIERHTAHVAFHPHRAFHRAGFQVYARRLGLRLVRLLHQSQLADVHLQLQDARLHLHLALGVGGGKHRSLTADGEDFHRVALADFLRRQPGIHLLQQALGQIVHVVLDAAANRVHLRVGVLLLLLHALQIRNDALGFAARLLHDAACVRLGFLDGVLALVFHLLAELLGLVAQLDRLSARLTRNLALAFRHLTVIFRVGDNVLKAHGVAGQQLLRVVNEVFRQTQTAADFKGVGLARHADGQAVGRAQRLHIELDGSVLHALGGQCECLQFAVMRRRQRPHTDVQQALQNRLRQRRALGRVSARAQFVEQHQIIRRHLVHDGHNRRHMPGEGGQALLDGLLVANIGEHLLKYRQFRPQIRRDLQARLRHQRQQTDRFQRNRLAARVRAGDNQRREVLAHPQV